MSTPSIDAPDVRIEDAMQQPSVGRLARAGGADQRDRLARLAVKLRRRRRRALAVVGEGHVLEGDGAGEPAGIDRARRSARSARVEHLEELGSLGACMNR
jgi:hypothetical protein